MSVTTEKPSAYFPGLVDICRGDDGEPVFMIHADGKYSLEDSIETEYGKFKTPELSQLPFLLPSASKVMKYIEQEDANLYTDLLTYLKRFSHLDDLQWTLAAHYVFLTYLHDHEDIGYCPYILFYAVPERGKSRTGKSLAFVSFRGIHLIDMREPLIFRFTNNLRGTLFFDLMDLWKKAEKNGCEDILLLRAEKGAKCARVLHPEKGAFNDMVYFDIYGPTIIATNEQLHKILETRCLPIIMPNHPGNYENPKPELALNLKTRLTAWRAKNIFRPIEEISPCPGVSGRLWDISKPLFQVCKLVDSDNLIKLMEAMLQISGEQSESKRDTLEGRITAIIQELTKQEGCEGFVSWNIKTIDIVRKYNEGRPLDKHVSAQWMGKKLKSLSLRHRTVNGRSEILLAPKEYKTLLDQYGCSDSELRTGGESL